MGVADLTGSKIMTQGSQIKRVYHKNNIVYDYELKDVQVGSPIVTQPGYRTSNVSYLFEWDSFTSAGSVGISNRIQTAHFINGHQIGAGFNERIQVVSSPTDTVFYKGTNFDTHRKRSITSTTNMGSTSTYPTRIRFNLGDLITVNGGQIVFAFRVSNTGANAAALSGSARYKYMISNHVSTHSFTTSVNRTHLGSSGNALHVIDHSFQNNNNSLYGDYLELYFTRAVTGIYDVNIYYYKDMPAYHTVLSGESLWSISAMYGLTLDALIALNGKTEAWTIHPGNKVLVRRT